MNYEWGPWIEHDGNGCPPWVIGHYVYVEHQSEGWCQDNTYGRFQYGVATGNPVCWDESHPDCWSPIIRYRIRRPRVTEWLDEITSDVPEREDA